MPRGLSVVLVLLLFLTAFAPEAAAKTKRDFDVNYDILYYTCVRLIRVDMNWKIVDKDKEAGYILFEFSAKDIPPTRASVELLRSAAPAKKNAPDPITVQVTVGAASSIEERMFLSDLSKKLKEEN